MKGKLPFWLKIYLTLQSLVQQKSFVKSFFEQKTYHLRPEAESFIPYFVHDVRDKVRDKVGVNR